MKRYGSAVVVEDEGEREQIDTIDLAGTEVAIYRVADDRILGFITLMNAGLANPAAAGEVVNFVADALDSHGRTVLQRAIRSGGLRVVPSQDDEVGLLDLAFDLVEASGSRPTQPSPASAPRRKPTGASSTAGSRRVRSTPVNSRSNAS